MAVTGTSAWSSVVHAAYHKDYYNAWLAKSVWMKLVNWRGTTGDVRGSTINFPVNERLARVTSALDETLDVTPVTKAPVEVAVTVQEFGNAVQSTKLLDATTYTDAHRMIAEQVAENAVNSLDYYVRGKAMAASFVMYPTGCVARTDLDASNDVPDLDEVMQLVEMASSREIPPFDDGSYVSVVHPAGVAMLLGMSGIQALAEYSDPNLIYTGESALKENEHFPGEVFRINNLRIVRHPWGKVYLGAGTQAQATTLASAAAAGDTSIVVSSASGIAVGDWLTIGTVESGTTQQPTTEQVRVTGVNSTTISIYGAGLSNGLMFAHDSGAAVTEAANVFAIPVFGKNSVVGYYDPEVGLEGRTDVREHVSTVPGRFWNYSWYWLGGVALVDKFCLRGEFATKMGLVGAP